MIPLALVYAVHLGLVFVGFKSLPMEQMAVLAGAFTVLSMGAMRLIRVR